MILLVEGQIELFAKKRLPFKVHLTPKFFFRCKKSSCFGEYFFEKIVRFDQILNFLCPFEVEFRMNHDRVNGDLGRVEL